MSLISSSRVYMTTMYIPRIVFGSSKTDTVFLLKRKTLFVLLSSLTLYHQHILCDLVVVFGSPCLIILNHMKRLLSQVRFLLFDSVHKVHTPKHQCYSVFSKTSQSRQNKRSFFLSGLQLLSLRVIESWRYISNATFPLAVLYTVFLCSF